MSESILVAAQQLQLSTGEFRKLDNAQGERVLTDRKQVCGRKPQSLVAFIGEHL